MPLHRSERVWIAGATAVGALFAFFVVFLPARGMTFYWDDWLILDRFVRLGRPAAWLVPENQQWEPVAFLFLDVERALFGPNHTLYLAIQWVLHSANVLLLALVLRARTGDARAAAVAAATFGVAVCYREVLWFFVDTVILLSMLVTLAGFLLAERAREGGKGWTVATCATVVAAPMCWGGGMALGPALALEAWVLSGKKERWRRAAPYALTWAAVVLLYLGFAGGSANNAIAKTPEQRRGAALFFCEVVGLGFVQQVPHVSLGDGPLAGVLLALGYAALVAVLAFVLPQKLSRRVLLAHAWLVLLIAPMALTRWWHNDRNNPLAVASRYQYLPCVAWTTLLAALLAARPHKALLAAAIGVVLLLGLRHAGATREDARLFSPYSRREYRDGLAWVHALERAARGARGPLYDMRAPVRIAPPEITASKLLAILAPDVAPVWTSARTPETVAPYEGEPGFAPDFTWR